MRAALEFLAMVLLMAIMVFGFAAFSQVVEPVVSDSFKIPDPTKLFDLLQAIGFFLLLLLGALTLVATYVGKLAKLIADYTETKLDDEKAQVIISFANRLSNFTLGFLHIFPTLGKNPTTKALEQKLEELKGPANESVPNTQG